MEKLLVGISEIGDGSDLLEQRGQPRRQRGRGERGGGGAGG